MEDMKNGSFGPIDLHMWEGPGWDLVRESAEKQLKDPVNNGYKFYAPLYGLRIPKEYKRD